ncbi:unnamed protein product [Linum trigynum]|uniref:Uncharacterized protein n=1 Tax=Linum trigynum TaxID=586398 RepID=A0AAV2G0N2_9ROSI
MAASSSSYGKKKGTGGGGSGGGGIINLKIVAKKLQKALGKKDASNYVPEDVKEGHFAVLAVEGVEEPQRFVVPLTCLTHPTFLRLLEQAAEEYGFDGGRGYGALTVPCRPEELERILAEQWEETTSSRRRNDNNNSNSNNGGGRDSWGSSSCKTMVQSF